jgi:hypothetical protein
MIKKAGYIILSVLFFLSTTGLVISNHYCCGELISTSFFVEAESCCDSDDCCKNETKVFQLDEVFLVSTALEIPETDQIDLFAASFIVFNIVLENNPIVNNYDLIDAQPPPKIRTSLAIRQTFLL